jgi:DNA-binding NarL/FixJ family response regulator
MGAQRRPSYDRPVVESTSHALRNPGQHLSPREVQVLDLASRGQTNSQIAAGLNVSVHAVKFHLAAVYRKLGVANRTEAATAYLRSSVGLDVPPSRLD